MAESNLWLEQEAELARDLAVLLKLAVLVRIGLNFASFDVLPAIRADLVAVHIREDMRFVAAAIDVELVEIAHERVVCARLGSILRIEIDPLFLQRLELGQVVEVDATFARVPSKEEDAVLEGETVGA